MFDTFWNPAQYGQTAVDMQRRNCVLLRNTQYAVRNRQYAIRNTLQKKS